MKSSLNILNFLKKVILFSNFSDDEALLISNILKIIKVSKKEIIFEDGGEASGFYIVYNGKIKIFKTSYEGKEHILHIFGPSQIFGEVPVFSNKNFPASALAIEDSELLFIPKDDFINLINKYPKLALNMLSVLSLRLHTFTNVIEELSLKDVPARLASYLLLVKDSSKSQTFELDITKNQLASLLGTIPETLSRVLNKFLQSGIIEYNGKSIILKDIETIDNISKGFEKI